MINRLVFALLIVANSGLLLHANEEWCYLASMPAEVLNRIAFFLVFPDRESDDEFIARTKQEDQVPAQLWQPYIIKSQVGVMSSGLCDAYSPHKDKFVLFEKTWFRDHNITPKLTIVDIKAQKVLWAQDGFDGNVNDIALSQNAKIVAIVQSMGISADFQIKVLSIPYGTVTHTFNLPRCSCHYATIAFNKQSTKLIAHHHNKVFASATYIDYNTKKCTVSAEKPYDIFPLVSPEGSAKAEEKTLLGYFYNKLVCISLGSMVQ